MLPYDMPAIVIIKIMYSSEMSQKHTISNWHFISEIATKTCRCKVVHWTDYITHTFFLLLNDNDVSKNNMHISLVSMLGKRKVVSSSLHHVTN